MPIMLSPPWSRTTPETPYDDDPLDIANDPLALSIAVPVRKIIDPLLDAVKPSPEVNTNS
jgi:hypothetical protein